MKVSRSVELASLAFAGLATVAVTSWLLQRPARSQAAPPRASLPKGTTTDTVTRIDPNNPNPVQPLVVPPNPTMLCVSSVIGGAEVAVENGLMSVSTQFSILDMRPNMQYVWQVRILTPDKKKCLWQKRYDDQSLAVPQGVMVTPVLEDAFPVPLPSGEYRLESSVSQVFPNDNGFTALDNPKLAEARREASSTTILKY